MSVNWSNDTAGDVWPAVAYLAGTAVYLAAGALAWSRRPNNRLGALIMTGGFVLETNGLDAGAPALIAVGQMSATLPLAVLVHVLHAFPSGRLRSRTSRCTVLAGYAVCLVLQAPLYLFAHAPAPYDVLVVDDRPGLVEAGKWVQAVCGCAVIVATIGVLFERLRATDSRRRRVLAPLYIYGILALLCIPISADLLAPWLGWSADTRELVQLVDISGVPVAFTSSLLLGGFARTGEIDELGAWLGTSHTGRDSLAAALRRALGDDSLRLLFWSAELDRYVDERGNHFDGGGPGRGCVDIVLAQERIGAVDYDVALNPDRVVVEAACRVIATSLDRERVSAELRTSQHLLRQSRVRIVEAGEAERRRIARDMHDGLQVRLVLLAMQTQQLVADDSVPEHVRAVAVELRQGIDAAAAQARGLMHDVLPAALVEGGLLAAAEDLLDHSPVPARLHMSLGVTPLPSLVESTAYFVIAEAIGNALKHADAHTLTLHLDRVGDVLRVEVADDGCGGAHLDPGSGLLDPGSGLRGLHDRVDTLGGRLSVDSPDGAGTRVVAELPCVLPD